MIQDLISSAILSTRLWYHDAILAKALRSGASHSCEDVLIIKLVS